MDDHAERASVPPPPPRASAPARRAPRYSMRTLLIVVTIAAVAAALIPYVGALLAAIVLTLVVPVCLATLAWYCRGRRQTFFLGGLAGALGSYFVGDVLMRTARWKLLAMAISEVAAVVICGYAALATRGFLERRDWHLPDRDDGTPPVA